MRWPGRSPLRFLPVALLILGITVHGARIVTYDEDPQRGTAFAMFATVDVGSTRRVIATAPGDPAVTIVIPADMEEQRDGLADRPTEGAARGFAAQLLERSWEVSDRTARVGQGAVLDQVRVQVVGLDADGRTLSRQVLTDVIVRNSSR